MAMQEVGFQDDDMKVAPYTHPYAKYTSQLYELDRVQMLNDGTVIPAYMTNGIQQQPRPRFARVC